MTSHKSHSSLYSLTFTDPVDICSALRSEIGRFGSAMEAINLWARNEEMVGRLREIAADLVTKNGQHHADILAQLYTDKLSTFEAKPDEKKQIVAARNHRSTHKRAATKSDKSAAANPKPTHSQLASPPAGLGGLLT